MWVNPFMVSKTEKTTCMLQKILYWINKDNEITVSRESNMTLFLWFLRTESATGSMLLWFKPAGQFVRNDLTQSESQKLEESSLLKTDSFHEGLRTARVHNSHKDVFVLYFMPLWFTAQRRLKAPCISGMCSHVIYYPREWTACETLLTLLAFSGGCEFTSCLLSFLQKYFQDSCVCIESNIEQLRRKGFVFGNNEENM